MEFLLEFKREEIPVANEQIQITEMIIRPKDAQRKLIAVFKMNDHIVCLIHGQPLQHISISKQILKKDQENILFIEESLSLK